MLATDEPGKPIVGIPRALLYYEYQAFWKKYLEMLGATVVVSPPTNRLILDEGVKLSCDESCLPTKVYCGHASQIAKRVQYLFAPRIVSVRPKEYTCPKLLGLPDMLRPILTQDTSLLSPVLDLTWQRSSLYKACLDVARGMQIRADKVPPALACACVAQAREHRRRRAKPVGSSRNAVGCGLRVGVIGHSYLLEDESLNLGVTRMLRECGVSELLTEHSLRPSSVERASCGLGKPLFWTFEKRVAGSAMCFIRDRLVDGIIQVVSFGCGPDSMVASLIQSHASHAKMPYMMLTIDEHTGEVGIRTRIEAFCDMLRWTVKASI